MIVGIVDPQAQVRVGGEGVARTPVDPVGLAAEVGVHQTVGGGRVRGPARVDELERTVAQQVGEGDLIVDVAAHQFIQELGPHVGDRLGGARLQRRQGMAARLDRLERGQHGGIVVDLGQELDQRGESVAVVAGVRIARGGHDPVQWMHFASRVRSGAVVRIVAEQVLDPGGRGLHEPDVRRALRAPVRHAARIVEVLAEVEELVGRGQPHFLGVVHAVDVEGHRAAEGRAAGPEVAEPGRRHRLDRYLDGPTGEPFLTVTHQVVHGVRILQRVGDHIGLRSGRLRRGPADREVAVLRDLPGQTGHRRDAHRHRRRRLAGIGLHDRQREDRPARRIGAGGQGPGDDGRVQARHVRLQAQGRTQRVAVGCAVLQTNTHRRCEPFVQPLQPEDRRRAAPDCGLVVRLDVQRQFGRHGQQAGRHLQDEAVSLEIAALGADGRRGLRLLAGIRRGR